MRTKRSAALGLVLLALVPALHGQSAPVYGGRLAPVPLSGAMVATHTGVGQVTATLKGRTLVIQGTFEGLQTPATVARLHRAQKGVRGPAVFDLTTSGGTSGTISATIELSPSQVDDLGRERFYVQLHSEKAPDGNLWGWLMPRESRR